jgi:hypothetical protein
MKANNMTLFPWSHGSMSTNACDKRNSQVFKTRVVAHKARTIDSIHGEAAPPTKQDTSASFHFHSFKEEPLVIRDCNQVHNPSYGLDTIVNDITCQM